MDALGWLARARREAAADRRSAAMDRLAAAGERGAAQLDRGSALLDRAAGTTHRAQAAADRGASADEREAASLDGLTGAHNRGPGVVELEREMARAKRAAQSMVVAFFDVDRLKVINDSRGHVAGDRMLLEVVQALRSKLRSFDLVIRYGGDEFVCALPGTNIVDARKRLAEINAVLADAVEPGSVTVGLAEMREDDSAADLIARADAALYREREQHRQTR
jgi:diguanylate cyclase (GGDEF)-like protein